MCPPDAMSTNQPVQNTGLEFADVDVAQAYLRRPPYPDALVARLIAIAPAQGHALDLGCGPGKLARPLAAAFERVTAIDSSGPMIAVGRAGALGQPGNIDWVCAPAEAADFRSDVDLAVAGASLHWMRHDIVFPKLCDALLPGAPIAVVDGDGPSAAPWLEAYRDLIVRWVERMGFVFGDPEFRARMSAHEAWIDIQGREAFSATRTMPIEHLIESEHSRATWARAKMGGAAADAFDADLRSVLGPHAVNNEITFDVQSKLLWGLPRRTPV